MAEKQTALLQLKKLDEKRAKLLESAKADALARAKEAINELIGIGFEDELTEYGTNEKAKPRRPEHAKQSTARRKGRARYANTRPIPRMIKGLVGLKRRRSRLPMQNWNKEASSGRNTFLISAYSDR